MSSRFLLETADETERVVAAVFFSGSTDSLIDRVDFPKDSDTDSSSFFSETVTSLSERDEVMEIILELSGEIERSDRELWLLTRERLTGDSPRSEREGECCRSFVEICDFCFSITSVTV